MVRNPNKGAYFSVEVFMGCTFGGKWTMDAATTRAPYGLGPLNPTKKLVHWLDLLSQPLSVSLNYVLAIFSGDLSPPPPLTLKSDKS